MTRSQLTTAFVMDILAAFSYGPPCHDPTVVSCLRRQGCTPLHWAAIRGNSEACTILLQVGQLPCL